MNQLPPVDFDGQWKKVIRNLHHPFMDFYFSELSKLIDYTIPPNFLDKELQKITPKWGKKGNRESDILIEYQLLDGAKQLILVHIEIQGTYKKMFTKRMFISAYRLRDQYPEHKLTALAVYTGDRIPKQHNTYYEEFFGMKIRYEFNTYIVRNQEEQDLIENADNPFALVTLAALYLIQAGENLEERFRFKQQLGRLCVLFGHDKDFFLNLINFVKYIIAVRPEQEALFEKTIDDMTNTDTSRPIDYNWLNIMAKSFGKTADDFFKELKEREIERLLKVTATERAEKEAAVKARIKEQAEKEKAVKARIKEQAEKEKAVKARIKEQAEKEKAVKARIKEQAEKEKAVKARIKEQAEKEKERAEKEKAVKEALEIKHQMVLLLHETGASIDTIVKKVNLKKATVKTILQAAQKK